MKPRHSRAAGIDGMAAITVAIGSFAVNREKRMSFDKEGDRTVEQDNGT